MIVALQNGSGAGSRRAGGRVLPSTTGQPGLFSSDIHHGHEAEPAHRMPLHLE